MAEIGPAGIAEARAGDTQLFFVRDEAEAMAVARLLDRPACWPGDGMAGETAASLAALKLVVWRDTTDTLVDLFLRAGARRLKCVSEAIGVSPSEAEAAAFGRDELIGLLRQYAVEQEPLVGMPEPEPTAAAEARQGNGHDPGGHDPGGLEAAAPEPTQEPEPEPPPWDALVDEPVPQPQPLAAPAARAQGQVDAADAWRAKLTFKRGKFDEQGAPVVEPRHISNAVIMLMHDPEVRGILLYDDFSSDCSIERPVPWNSALPAEQYPYSAGKDDITGFRMWLEKQGVVLGHQDVGRAMNLASKRRIVNPVRDYFKALTWDGRPRLDTWASYYLGAVDSPLIRAEASKWLIGGVRRVFEPGSKMDYVLILEGKQNLGKSSALRILATLNGRSYFSDVAVDIKNKDALISLRGIFIWEIAELASMHRGQVDDMKGFVSREVDIYRSPYDERASKWPRKFIVAGSVNPGGGGYLRDPTGGRRFWPIECTAIDLKALEEDRDQLWAEAYVRYRAGEPNWLPRELEAQAIAQQDERRQPDPWEDPLAEYAGRREYVNAEDFLEHISIPVRERDGRMRIRVTEILKMWGYTCKKERDIDGRSRRLWRRRPQAEPDA